MFDKQQIINDQYEVLERLTGGMGHVYIVFDQVTKRKLAVKTPKDELIVDRPAMARFEREARTWTNLGSHDNIVHAISYYRGNPPLLILEYVEGINLRQLIGTEPAGMAFSDAIKLGIQIGEGLAHAHSCTILGDSRGLVHRDLKPGNIMITRGCQAKLTDFGLARVLGDTEYTSSDHALGTLQYMPPEQWNNPRNVTHAADLYALGVILYEMLAGTRPFPPGIPTEIMFQTLNSDPDPLDEYRPDTDQQLARLIMQCLAKDSEERPESAASVVSTLREIESRLAPIFACDEACASCGYVAYKGHVLCPVCDAPPKPKEIRRSCPDCGLEVPEKFRFCIHCGQPTTTPRNRCTKCSKDFPGHFQFCLNCGCRLACVVMPE